MAEYSFRKTKICCAKERGDYSRARTSEDLDLIATATSEEEWFGRIEYLPIG